MKLEWYQYLLEHINPIAVSVGFFSIRWYSIMYLVAFATVYFLLSHRIRKKENLFEINKCQLTNLLIYLILGLLVGARLGYVLFYDLNYFISHPLEIISPVQITNYKLQITGIFGMSYFGGLIGVILAGWIYARRQKINFWQLADFAVPAIPAGYFFGRLGNFLNGELFGRVTNVPWGMYFPADSSGMLRHPSQLYEALLEGAVLFLVLWHFRNSSWLKGRILPVYLLGYAIFRFGCEFFREPDPQTGFILGIFTYGQFLSVILFLSAIWYLTRRLKLSL